MLLSASSKQTREILLQCLHANGYNAEWIISVTLFIFKIKHHSAEPIIESDLAEINESGLVYLFIYFFVRSFALGDADVVGNVFVSQSDMID